MAALLLEKGAQIDLQDNDGDSALTLASCNGHTEVTALLLEKGAQIDMLNKHGRSALMATDILKWQHCFWKRGLKLICKITMDAQL